MNALCVQSPVIESLVDEGIVSDCLRVEVEQALSTPYLSEEEHRTLTSTTTLPVPDLVRVSSLTLDIIV